MRRAPVGQRNHTLNAAAFNLGQFVGAGRLGAEEVASLLLSAARTAGLADPESRRTITSGLRSGATYPREVA